NLPVAKALQTVPTLQQQVAALQEENRTLKETVRGMQGVKRQNTRQGPPAAATAAASRADVPAQSPVLTPTGVPAVPAPGSALARTTAKNMAAAGLNTGITPQSATTSQMDAIKKLAEQLGSTRYA